jgi:hypothetical protein
VNIQADLGGRGVETEAEASGETAEEETEAPATPTAEAIIIEAATAVVRPGEAAVVKAQIEETIPAGTPATIVADGEEAQIVAAVAGPRTTPWVELRLARRRERPRLVTVHACSSSRGQRWALLLRLEREETTPTRTSLSPTGSQRQASRRLPPRKRVVEDKESSTKPPFRRHQTYQGIMTGHSAGNPR